MLLVRYFYPILTKTGMCVDISVEPSNINLIGIRSDVLKLLTECLQMNWTDLTSAPRDCDGVYNGSEFRNVFLRSAATDTLLRSNVAQRFYKGITD
jgi:hypothetical protein